MIKISWCAKSSAAPRGAMSRLFSPLIMAFGGISPTEKNRPNLGNRRLNVPAVYIMPQLGHCQHAPSLPGRADTYPHPLISFMLLTYKKTEVKADVLAGLAVPFFVRPECAD